MASSWRDMLLPLLENFNHYDSIPVENSQTMRNLLTVFTDFEDQERGDQQPALPVTLSLRSRRRITFDG
ncbi:MAG: hypothetical protein HPY76_11410 [Anaerolineae bacterium]|nr:hypothetical protein [Anaerolineae bacterium]